MASNIKQNFLEMKNLSELMVDLAYSALFLQDKSVALEVEQMYEHIKMLEDDTTKLLFRIKESDERRMLILDLIDQIKNLSNAAMHIAKLVTSEEVPGIIKEALSQTDERIIVLEVSAKSSLCDRSVGTMHLGTRTGARIRAIRRKGDWLFKIDEGTVIHAKDQLVATGTDGAEKRLAEWAAGRQSY